MDKGCIWLVFNSILVNILLCKHVPLKCCTSQLPAELNYLNSDIIKDLTGMLTPGNMWTSHLQKKSMKTYKHDVNANVKIEILIRKGTSTFVLTCLAIIQQGKGLYRFKSIFPLACKVSAWSGTAFMSLFTSLQTRIH